MKTEAILDQLILVVLNISLWEGRKALKMGDLALNGIDVDKLPPGTLATLGSKRIISPDAVKTFSSLRRLAKQLCQQNGVRFGGKGYAIPRAKVAVLSRELNRIKGEFSVAKNDFLSVYEAETEKWIDSNPPEWAPIIRAAVDSPQHIQKAISFNFAVLDIKVPTDIEENGLDDEIDSLYGKLCYEVRVTARRAFENNFVGKQEITHKKLRPIKSIREKLVGLSFLDPTIPEIIHIIDDTLSKLPEKGNITGTDLNMVAGLLGRQLANMGRTVKLEQVDAEGNDDAADETDIVEVITIDDAGIVEPITWDF